MNEHHSIIILKYELGLSTQQNKTITEVQHPGSTSQKKFPVPLEKEMEKESTSTVCKTPTTNLEKILQNIQVS